MGKGYILILKLFVFCANLTALNQAFTFVYRLVPDVGFWNTDFSLLNIYHKKRYKTELPRADSYLALFWISLRFALHMHYDMSLLTLQMRLYIL